MINTTYRSQIGRLSEELLEIDEQTAPASVRVLSRGVQTRSEELVGEHSRAMDAWAELQRRLELVRALAQLCRDAVSLQGVFRELLTPLLRSELGALL